MNEKTQMIETRVRGLQSETTITGSPERAANLVAEIDHVSGRDKPMIAEMKRGVQSAHAKDAARHTGQFPPAGTEPRFEARRLALALWVTIVAVMGVDATCAALLGALSFNLARLPAILVGLFLSLTVCLVTAAAWRAILVIDASCPAKSLKVLRAQLKVLCPSYLSCIVFTLLLGRLVSLATHNGTSLLLCLLTALSVLGPMLCASMVSMADLISWARRHETQFRRLTRLELAIGELERAASRLRAPAFPKQPLALTAAVVVALLLFCGADAKAAECGSLWIDSSGSVSGPERLQAGTAAIAQLPNWAESSGCRVWALYAFAGASFSDVPFDIFTLPESPAAVCPKLTTSNELNIIFRGPAEEAEKERLQKCATSGAEERRKFQAAVDAQINQAFERLKAVKPVAPLKTCIVDTLQRLSEDRTRLALVATDGGESCILNFHGSIPSPPTRKQVVMVLIGQKNLPNGVSPGQYFAQERKLWQTRAPWLSNIIPASGIDDKTFGSIAVPAAQSALAWDSRYQPR